MREITVLDPIRAVVESVKAAEVGAVLIVRYVSAGGTYSEAIIKTGEDGYKAAYGYHTGFLKTGTGSLYDFLSNNYRSARFFLLDSNDF